MSLFMKMFINEQYEGLSEGLSRINPKLGETPLTTNLDEKISLVPYFFTCLILFSS